MKSWLTRFGVWNLLLAFATIVTATATIRFGFHLTNPTLAAVSFLLVVLITATVSRLWVAIATSILADLCLNYFFLPPLGTFVIADPENWVALFAFLAVSLVTSNLSAAARGRAREALARRDELARLFDLSRDVLLTTDSREAITQLPRFVSQRFDLDFLAICLPRSTEWDIFKAGTLELTLDKEELTRAFDGVEDTPRGAETPVRASHRTMTIDSHTIRIVPLQLGTRAVGLLAAAGRPMEPGTLDALAGLAAIAIERAQFLEERKAAELARQSAALKSALLASLGHDLRTPLTAIRVAASNLQASWLGDVGRREQSDLILTEVGRLNRLFQNILEMARIDAGAVAAEARWVHPSEIIEAARDQVGPALCDHRLDIAIESDALVHVDPRLTGGALAQLLENAAWYSPEGSLISVTVSVSAEDFVVTVRDRGPGIAPQDLPHLFERFYRGREASRRASGAGMGLSIARGMLVAERGRVWAENRPDGGALFTIVVPAESRAPALAEQAP